MRFLGSNATEMRKRPGLHPGPCWGSLQHSPDPLAGFEGAASPAYAYKTAGLL